MKAVGRTTRRELKYDSGLLRIYDLFWDGDDRLRGVKEGTTTHFTGSYDGGGLRVSKWDSWTGQHDYSWGPGGIVHDSSGSTTYTPGLAHRQGTADRFYHSDWIGSTRYLSDGTGNSFPSGLRFDAYGQRSATAGPDHPTEFLFAGAWGYQTEYQTGTEPGLGLQYLEQRYYDPAIGRFISPDPIGYAGGLNLYSYTGNDPVNAVDPTGLVGEETGDPVAGMIRQQQEEAFVDHFSPDGPPPLRRGFRGRWGSVRAAVARMRLSTLPALPLAPRLPALPAQIPPRGFSSASQFNAACDRFQAAAGVGDGIVGVRGSAATGVRFRGGSFGPNSDIDFFMVSDRLYGEALRRGATPHPRDYGTLGVRETRRFPEIRAVERALSAQLRRKVSIRIMSHEGYRRLRSPTDVLGR